MATTTQKNSATHPNRKDQSPSEVASVAIPLAGLGDLLIAARKERGLTQVQLAARLGMLQTAVARWEREKYRTAGLDRIVKVAEALEVRLVVMTALADSDALESYQNTKDFEPV